MPAFFSLTSTDLKAELTRLNLPAYQADHAFRIIYQNPAEGWQGVSPIKKELRENLGVEIPVALPVTVADQRSKDGTRKVLSKLADGQTIETVWIPSRERMTVCISSQVGCKLDCKFCQTGQGGFFRNLTPDEIVGQLVVGGRRPDNIVFMGMGEPLDNLESLAQSIRVLHEPNGMNMGWRRLTVSTVGLIPAMQKLSAEFPEINWAISLHSLDQDVRQKIMPIGKKYDVDAVVDAAGEIFRRTGRRVSFEWVCLEGVNDRDADLHDLMTLLTGEAGFHLNLLPYHPTTAGPFTGTSRKRIHHIADELEGQGCHVTVRESRGLDIDGACGQLRVRQSA